MTTFLMAPTARFRIAMSLFILGLVISGATAFPLLTELRILHRMVDPADSSGLGYWIATVRHGLEDAHIRYPWMAYGTDWLAFGHLVIALFFIGPLMNPRSSKANLYAGIVACLGVIPIALICGPIRGIPFYWRLIDCSFGVLGLIPLIYCLRLLPKIESQS